MIQYPKLKNHYTIGVTAPSSGIDEHLHNLIHELKSKFNDNHKMIIGDTTFTQYKAKAGDAKIRGNELKRFLQSTEVDIIIPPWGGELAIEVLEYIDYKNIVPKWIIGYSDISPILLSITLKTGMATAHGTNLVDLRGKYSDTTTAKWETVLKTKEKESVIQYSSEHFQSKWDHSKTSEYVFNFDKDTLWKSIGDNNKIKFEGRILGGCIDVIHHLVGTPYGDVKAFRNKFINNEPLIWYLENCEQSPVELRRSLVQMRYAGWFENCNGIMFGRTPVDFDTEGYTIEDVYQDIANDLNIPIIYDIDCGHQPPQITFINGSYGVVEYKDGEGTVIQKFI
ncbi:S66 peptidase family protein [Macrococcus equi]|uniref:S66 family peptidase n=1 Tax=Macrococcus equi TaxID=3395462 RepID=UPI0039BE2DA1